MEKIKFFIDGREVIGEKGDHILDVALRNGIEIPHLCWNEALKPYGACRLCLVEVERGNRRTLTTSCTYPIEEGIKVYTATEEILKHRRVVMELLLARSPNAPVIQKMAAEMGIHDVPFEKGDDDCILCGLCVRACEQVVGVSAIGFVERGTSRKVGTPFDDPSKTCIGCGTCAYICPTNVIEMVEEDGVRKIWNSTFKMRKCKKCGNYWIPEKQVEFILQTTKTPKEFFDYCPDCRD